MTFNGCAEQGFNPTDRRIHRTVRCKLPCASRDENGNSGAILSQHWHVAPVSDRRRLIFRGVYERFLSCQLFGGGWWSGC